MSSRLGGDPFHIREPRETISRIKRFLKTHTDRIGARSLIVGMSGGLDSSVTAALCALTLGGARVLGICMPEKETRNMKNIEDARIVAKKFGIRFKIVDITPLVEVASKSILRIESRRVVPYGNVKARLRAIVLYYYANMGKGLVVGTGDKSEIMLGYFTKHGDGACDIQPLADLYKTSVRELARHIGFPKRIFSKPPSPELWPGQTAEKELGLGYEKIDLILWGLERWMRPEDIAREVDMPVSLVNSLRDRWIGSEHKRRPPLAMKLGYRTVGYDFRLPYTLEQK